MSKFLPSTKDGGSNYPSNQTKDPVYGRWGEAGFVPKFRKISTGVGLKGGNNLVEDMTLCVNFGDTEGTAVEGNDPRLMAARDWLAELVTESAAIEGTEETAQKWSASLVHVAIGGWWEASTYKTKLNNIATGATKNKTDSHLLDRQFHTGTQAMSTIIGLEEALSRSGGTSGSLFSKVKTVTMGNKVVYDLQPTDVGLTLVLESYLDDVDIRMPFCFGAIGDEIYIVAPNTYYPTSTKKLKFYSELVNIKFAPRTATGLLPAFREGNSIVCLKKVSDKSDGMVNWLLFGDLAIK